MTMMQQLKLHFFTSSIQSLLDKVHFQHFPPLLMKDFMNHAALAQTVFYSCCCIAHITDVSLPCYSSTTGV